MHGVQLKDSDLIFHRLSFLGPETSLTVILDTPEVQSPWLLKTLADTDTVAVTFTTAATNYWLQSSQVKRVLDYSGDIFTTRNGRFSTVSLAEISRKVTALQPKRVELEHPGILVASQLVEPAELVHFVQSLLDVCQVVMSCTIAMPLLDTPLKLSTDLDYFVTSLLHQADLIVNVRPLKTGHAQDTTGQLRVAAGPRSDSSQVNEQDYLYEVRSNVVYVRPR